MLAIGDKFLVDDALMGLFDPTSNAVEPRANPAPSQTNPSGLLGERPVQPSVSRSGPYATANGAAVA